MIQVLVTGMYRPEKWETWSLVLQPFLLQSFISGHWYWCKKYNFLLSAITGQSLLLWAAHQFLTWTPSSCTHSWLKPPIVPGCDNTISPWRRRGEEGGGREGGRGSHSWTGFSCCSSRTLPTWLDNKITLHLIWHQLSSSNTVLTQRCAAVHTLKTPHSALVESRVLLGNVL